MKTIVKPKPIEGKEWSKGLQYIEKPIPEITKPTDTIISVFAGAICGTDVGIYTSKDSLRVEMSRALTDPVTLGHEFSGKISDAGKTAKKHISQLIFAKVKTNPEIKKLLKKETITSFAQRKDFLSIIKEHFNISAEMHITCGTCYQCKLGEKHVCRNTIIKGVHDDGAFAQFVKIPAENLVIHYHKEIPLEIMAFMDALGNATHTVFSAEVKGRNVLVLGCGVQGLMAVAVAKYAGAKKIYVTDASHGDFSHEKLQEKRFSKAKEYGATECFDMSIQEEKERFSKIIMEQTQQTGVDAAFEMSGSYYAYADALKVLRMGGTFSLLGLPAGTMPVDFAKDIIFKGITIKGIIGRKVFETWEQMEVILKAGLAKKFLKSGFITHQFPLAQYEEAFDVIKKGDAFKVLLKP